MHLEGSLEPEMVFALAQRNGIALEYGSVEALRDAYSFSNLQDFLDIYYTGMQVLRTASDFYDLTTAYCQRALKDNVRHAEVFFDPQAHTARGIPMAEMLEGIVAAIEEAALSGLSVYLIPCFLRHLSGQEASDTLRELEPFAENFCAVGLDSSELGHPPGNFRTAFDRARELGLKLVAHAGEEGPPEYVWEALDILQVDRVDHGNRALEDDALVERLRHQKVPLTVCPLSNLKLAVVDDLGNHPLKKMLDAGLVVTVNSDDPAYFGGYINRNFIDVASKLNLCSAEIITLAENSFIASFLPQDQKRKYLDEIEGVQGLLA